MRLGEETRLLLDTGTASCSLTGVVTTRVAELVVETVIERVGLVCAVALDFSRLGADCGME